MNFMGKEMIITQNKLIYILIFPLFVFINSHAAKVSDSTEEILRYQEQKNVYNEFQKKKQKKQVNIYTQLHKLSPFTQSNGKCVLKEAIHKTHPLRHCL